MNKPRKILEGGQLVSVIAVSLIAAVLIIGLSLKKKPEVVVMNATAEQVLQVDAPADEMQVDEICTEIKSVFHQPGRLEVITDGGLFALLRDSVGWSEPMPVDIDVQALKLNYILYERDRVIIGGDRLLVAGKDYLEVYSEHDFGSPVNVILKFGEGFLVGANTGLYYYNEDGVNTILKGDMLVTALAEDVGGLWIGTFGDGLWRYDGDRWQRRYLFRDNSIFDFVTALAYNYPFLWVGTPSGIFRYDGGRWNQLLLNDSSEVYEVNCFLPQILETYIGTEQGLFVYANDSLKAVPEFEDEQIINLFKDGKDILVATRFSGIFKLKGKEEILRPEHLSISRWDLAERE